MTDLQEKAMKMALERLESHEYWMDEKAIKALRQALAQPEQKGHCTCGDPKALGVVHFRTRPCFHYTESLAQPEQYDQTSLELCDVCGWKAIIPDEGCLVCARKNQEPVMWSIFDGKSHDVFDTKHDVDNIIRFKKGKMVVMPLYTAPPKREWVGLTDEERVSFFTKSQDKFWDWDDGVDIEAFIRAIEAKLKEKNGA